MSNIDLPHSVVDVLEEKKGEDILLLDIQNQVDFTDYFILCSGTSDRMLSALADAVAERAREEYKIRARIEGFPQHGWMVVDLGDVVVHLFSPDQRKYYQLEKLWQDGKILLHLQ